MLKLLARVDPTALAAEPLAVEQVRAGELCADPGAARDARSPRGTGPRRRRPRSAARVNAPRCRAPSRFRWPACLPRQPVQRLASPDRFSRCARPTRRARSGPSSRRPAPCARGAPGARRAPPRIWPRPLQRTARAYSRDGEADSLAARPRLRGSWPAISSVASRFPACQRGEHERAVGRRPDSRSPRRNDCRSPRPATAAAASSPQNTSTRRDALRASGSSPSAPVLRTI